jgi:hypothetical protein
MPGGAQATGGKDAISVGGLPARPPDKPPTG